MAFCKRILLCCLTALLFTGCMNTPVRHLASDASLVTPGTSTRNDVLTYLGDPDERQEKGIGPDRWFYYEEQRSAIQRTFFVGKWFGPKSVSRIIVTFDGDIVTDIQYNASESGQFESAGEQPDQETAQ